MRAMVLRFTAFYGSHPGHLLGSVAAWALAGYVVTVVKPHALWNAAVWWQSIAVWFIAATVAHDLILFPLCAFADRCVTAAITVVPAQRVSPLNYIRLPTLATGLSLLLFFPGIVQQGRSSYLAATGHNQQPFLGRWLLLVGALYGLSALAYAVRLAVARRADTG